jgi:predicted DNA-binding transcriptional regulator AlpA
VDLVDAASLPRRDEAEPAVAPAPRDPRDALKLSEAAEITGLAEQTLRNLRYKGEGPPFWVLRGRLRCYRSDLEEWMTGRG